jgi:amino acid transporter
LSWFRDIFKIYIQYLSVGFIAIVATLFYFGLKSIGVHQSISLVLSVCVGFVGTICGWVLIKKHLFKPKTVQEIEVKVFPENKVSAGFVPVIKLQPVLMATALHYQTAFVESGNAETILAINDYFQENITPSQPAIIPCYKIAQV